MVELNINEPLDAAQVVEVGLGGEGDSKVVGRVPPSDVVIDHPMLADQQCRLFVSGGRVMVENLDEEMGTIVNGELIRDPVAIADGDAIEMGTLIARTKVARGQNRPPTPEIEPQPAPQPDAARPPVPEPEPASDEPAPVPTPPPPPAPPPLPAPLPPPAPLAVAAPLSHAPEDEPSTASSLDGATPTSPPVMTDAAPARAAPVPTGDPALDSLIQELTEEFPEQMGRLHAAGAEGGVASILARAVERATDLGLETEEQVRQFIRCVVMLEDELASKDCRVPEVWFSLTHKGKTAQERIDRALKQATRAIERSSAPSAKPLPPPSISAQPEPAHAAGAAPKSRGGRSRGGSRGPGGGTRGTRNTPPPNVDDARQAEAPPVIEGFEIKDELGRGGMGCVYRAHYKQLDIDVAIKVLRTLHPDAQEQLLREARAAAKLQHPNIVQVFQYERLGQGGCYVMQLVRGQDAHRLLEEMVGADVVEATGDRIMRVCGVNSAEAPAELRDAASAKQPYYRMVATWMAGVADGLERAHREGIIHRDIKPSNLLLSYDGRMMIADFGLATPSPLRHRGGRARVGTPRYLAPERLADWACVADDTSVTDHRSDIWGLGAVLYEFLAFRPAYEGTTLEALRDIATVDPAPPATEVWSVPEGLEDVCLKAMARRPEERFASAAELAEALRAWVRSPQSAGVAKGQSTSWIGGKLPFLGGARQDR